MATRLLHNTASYAGYQWNSKWAFARKHDIFTRENNMLFSHVKMSPLRWLHNKFAPFAEKNCFIEMVWYFIGVYIINSTLHGRLEIRNFSSRVENILLVRCAHSWNIFQHSKRNFVSPRGHVISSICNICTSIQIHKLDSSTCPASKECCVR